MFSRCGCFFGLLSFVLTTYLSYSSGDVTGLAPLKCRIAGVLLVEKLDRSKNFNYTMAESMCDLLGLQLASKAHVETAWRYGFETCSYGWVTEKFGVISRIQNNEKCGRNKTGVLTWSIPLSGSFNAYCFNASDTQINSCKPGLMVTRPPSTVQTMPQSTAAFQAPITTEGPQTRPTTPAARPDIPTTPKARIPLTSPKYPPTRPTLTTLRTLPETTPPVSTQRGATTADVLDSLDNLGSPKQLLHKKEKAVFGGLPTTLLTLALVFFIAAAALAVCYVKKYKTSLIFTKKKEEKEAMETIVFKENITAENTEEEENKPNGKQASTPGKGLAAEV